MDMNIQKYMAFVKTVEYGSFTRAAEMLNYSQSGISRMINDLEKEWKVVLLERGKSGVKLTSDGMKLLANLEKIPVVSLCDEPFMLLEKGAKAEVSEIFERCNLTPKIHFTTWDDYAIMSMVESGLGISILPELILKRVPYGIVAKELDVPAYRKIGIALRSKKNASFAVKRFLDYLQYR